MVICIIALIVFSILGIFSVRWRRLAKEAFHCVFKMIQFKPCDVKLEERIKSKITAKLIKRTPTLARLTYKNFKALSWVFTIAFFASMTYSAYGIYNLVVYGSCQPGSGTCAVNQVTQVISCYEVQIVYGIIILAVALSLYLWLRGHTKIEFK